MNKILVILFLLCSYIGVSQDMLFREYPRNYTLSSPIDRTGKPSFRPLSILDIPDLSTKYISVNIPNRASQDLLYFNGTNWTRLPKAMYSPSVLTITSGMLKWVPDTVFYTEDPGTETDPIWISDSSDYASKSYVDNAIDGISSEWVGTATSDLNMADYNIDNADSVDIEEHLSAQEISFNSQTEWMQSFRIHPFYFQDFLYLQVSQYSPWYGAALSAGGQSTNGNGTLNHPGLLILKTGSTGTGTVYRVETTNGLSLEANYYMEGVFDVSHTTNTTVRFGFHNTNSASDPTEGMYINISGTTLTGKTTASSSTTTTSTSYTITQNTYYRFVVRLSTDKSTAYFYCYSEAGTLLWSDTTTTNISTSGLLRSGIIASGDDTNQNLILLDYMAISFGTLTR